MGRHWTRAAVLLMERCLVCFHVVWFYVGYLSMCCNGSS